MVTKRISVIDTYNGDNNVSIQIRRTELENGSLKLFRATITAFDGTLELLPSELISLIEILDKIRPEVS